MNGSHANIRSLNKAISTFTVEVKSIIDDQFLTSAVKSERHIATTDFVDEPKPSSSLISIVSQISISC